MPWASAAECAAVTGVTPDDATLTLAHSTVRTHINRSEDEVAAAATDRDFDHLRDAVAWQAAWLPHQPGILARSGVDTVSQDGFSAKYNSPADLLVAPYAQRALKNLSWMGSRSLRTTTRRPRNSDESEGPTAAAWLREGADPEHGWAPL